MMGPIDDRGVVIDTAAFTLYTPWSRPPVHLALECVMVGLGILTWLHALRARRAGEMLPLFTWSTVLIYGLAMELVSYHFVDNFEHAQFAVMLYRRKLPLYITAIYPVLLYTGIATVRRLNLPRWAEGFAAGFAIVALDVPFDVTGPEVGWWEWSATDPRLADRWSGVPVTSYYWHLAFGGILAALTAAVGPHVQTTRQLAFAVPTALLTMVLGVLAFLPLHALAALGVSHGVVVGTALALAAAILVAAPKRAAGNSDFFLMTIATAFYAFHAIVAAGRIPVRHLAFVFAGIAMGLAINVVAHRPAFANRRRAAAR